MNKGKNHKAAVTKAEGYIGTRRSIEDLIHQDQYVSAPNSRWWAS